MIENDDTIELPDGTEFVVVSRDEKKAVFKVSITKHLNDDNKSLFIRLRGEKLSSY